MHNDLLTRASRLQAFAARDPSNTALLRDLAQTYHGAGEHAQALAVLDQMTPEQQQLDGPLRGQLLLSLGRWSEAAQLFERALQHQPESPALWFNQGYALWAGGTAPQQAVQCLARAAELDPQNSRFRRLLAMAREAAGDLTGALQTLASAVAAGVVDTELLVLQCQLELDAGHVPAAQAAADRAVAAEPGAASAWQAKGQAALFALDAQAAAKALRQSLDLDGSDTDTPALLAQACLMLGRPHQARRLIDALAARGAADAAAMCLAGWACCAEDDMAAARVSFKAALAQDAESADALAGLGCVLLAGGDRDGARAMASRALALDPDHLTAKLVAMQLDAPPPGATGDKAAMETLLASMPFGPLNASLGQALSMPQVRAAAQRLNRHHRRHLAKPVSHPYAPH